MSRSQRKPTNLSLDPGLLAEARSLRGNLSRAAEDGVRAAVAREKARVWQRENAAALDGYNAFIAENGLPLDRYRQF